MQNLNEGLLFDPALSAEIKDRFYYVDADPEFGQRLFFENSGGSLRLKASVDSQHGGEWGGKAYMCTRRKMFTIAGVENCVARGYERTGFFEVDTAEQRSWTVHLYQPTQKGTSVK